MVSYLTLALLFVSTLTQAEDDNVQKGICNTFNVFKSFKYIFSAPWDYPFIRVSYNPWREGSETNRILKRNLKTEKLIKYKNVLTDLIKYT